MVMARAGLRIGKAVALQPEDLNYTDFEIRVERGFSAGRIETPKSGRCRTVDMSEQLAKVLQRYEAERKEAKLRWGWPDMPKWLFFSTARSSIPRASTRSSSGS